MGDFVILKLGIDGGGSFLKVSFTHIELEKNELEPQSPVQKNMKTTSPLSAKATSVKQQMLVALSQDTPETYQNVKQIFGLVKIHEKSLLDSLVISCDLKLANILCGIQSHSSKHPCCWCEAENPNLIRCGHPRTFGQIRKQFAEFMKSGGDIRKSRDFKNVVHLPLLDFHDDMLVLEAIPPMELHLLLGVVNHLFKNLCDLWPDAKQWPTTLHLSIQPLHGGHFNGNNCLKLLRGLDCLKQIAEQKHIKQADGFIQTLSLFKDVVTSCFGTTLDPDFEAKIESFKQSYINLPVSITPKVHAVFHHIPQFIKRKNMGLGLFSEQATEALHSNFKPFWDRYKRNPENPDYSKHLLSCVIECNRKKI